MNIEYVSHLKKPGDAVELYKALEWYGLNGYTDEDIEKANESFYSSYAYDGDTLVGLGRVASDGLIAAVMSGICVRKDYRRHGIGAEIVKRIVEYCQSGIYELNVQIFCEDSLIKWYEDMGFERLAVGMRKSMPHHEEHCALKKNFGEVYGIEQIAELSEDFYWYHFDAFGDFSYYSGIGSEGVKVSFIRMIFYSNEPVKFSAEIIFENVSEFEIGCLGVRTPLFGFDIISTEKYGYSEKKRYKVRSLEDDDISFFCEKFRIMDVNVAANTAQIASPERSAADIAAVADAAKVANAEKSADSETDDTETAALPEAPVSDDLIENENIPLPEIKKLNSLKHAPKNTDSSNIKTLLDVAADADKMLENIKDFIKAE